MATVTDFNLTPGAKKALKDSQLFAKKNGHGLINNSHIILGCLDNINVKFNYFVDEFGLKLMDPNSYKIAFDKFQKTNRESFVKAGSNNGLWDKEVEGVINESKEFAEIYGDYCIGVEHILYSALNSETPILDFLFENGLDIEITKSVLEKIVSESNIYEGSGGKKRDHNGDYGEENIVKQLADSSVRSEKIYKNLSKFCTNMNEEFLFANEKSNMISNRNVEIDHLIEVLSKKNKCNSVLVGEAGVGKTAIVEGLVQRIVFQEVPAHFLSKVVYSVDVGALIAGTKYRGEFEEKIKALIKEIEGKEDIILFFDEIHTIIDAGSASQGGGVDASNMLKPALARGDIKCIGATTSEEYKKIFEKDSALKRRFEKLEVKEPTKEETLDILKNSIYGYEDFHHVKFSEKSLEKIVNLCDRFIPEKKFPDKAFDVVDFVGSRAKIKHLFKGEKFENLKKSLLELDDCNTLEDYVDFMSIYFDKIDEISEDAKKKSIKITNKDIIEVISRRTGLSERAISEDNYKFNQFLKKISSEVFGQDIILKNIYNDLACAKIGLHDPRRPLANFLFAGPTSVGKTYTAKKIAKYFFGNERAFLQLNMSEYQDKTAVSKLIGANAGYVGFEEGGLLTEFVRNHPNSVILFDEIEKCEPKILDLLLHILDEGYVSDNLNRKIDLTKTIVIMTTNIGAKESEARELGFGASTNQTDKESKFIESVKKSLRPELISRIDNMFAFNDLSEGNFNNIIKVELVKIKERISNSGFSIKFSNTVKNFILNKVKESGGHARDVKNIVKKFVHVPLANYMIENKKNQEISVKVSGKSLVFKDNLA